MNLSNKRIILSSLIFVLVVLLLGIPFINWGFLHDDFGVIWHSQIRDYKDFFRLFSEAGMSVVPQPSNYIAPEQSFFVIYYRPLVYAFYSLQMAFFKFAPYGYFLVTIFLHAINSVILFNIFLLFSDFLLAFWCAMFFAFNPSLCEWIGWIAGQGHVFNFFIILLIILFLKKYLDSRRIVFYFLSCLFMILSIMTRETSLVLPFWIVYAAYLYENFMQYNTETFFISYKRYLTLAFPYLLVVLSYFLFRLTFYPIKLSGGSQIELNPLKFIINFKNRFYDLVTLLSDLVGTSFLPGGHQVLKGSLILLFFSVLFGLFIRNTKKKYIIFFALSMLMFMWPVVLRYYSSRYLYKALPFYILILLFLVKFYKSKSEKFDLKFKKTCLIVMYSLLFLNMVLLVYNMKKRENFLNKLHTAFDELVQVEETKYRPICFIGLPWSFFPTGCAQAVWMRGIDKPTYYDRRTWGFSNNAMFKNYLTIDSIEGGFRIKSVDPDKIWIAAFEQKEFAMADMFVHSYFNGRPCDVSFIFNKKYMDENLLFVTWDYENLKFIILNDLRRV